MILARQPRPRARSGYSLVELLLTTALLLMFAGVSVISLRTMSQGASLDEGSIRFESLLRFTHAEAANSGRRVRVNFVQEVQANDTPNPLNQVRLTWEANPVAEPDVFTSLPAARWGIDQINETVSVEGVQMTEAPGLPSSPELEAEPVSEETPPATATDDSSVSLAPAYITFNPDGSSESADITLAARSAVDSRRVIIRVDGLTGSICRLEETGADTAAPADALGSNPEVKPVGDK